MDCSLPGDTWTHLLYHPAFEGGPQAKFVVAGAVWLEIAVGFGLSMPWTTARFRDKWTKPFRRKQRVIRAQVLGHEAFTEAVYAETFGVAPEEWTETLREAWNPLEEPPSPYEMAALLLNDGKYWIGAKGKDRPMASHKSSLYWWLVGIPAHVMEQVAPGWEEEAAYAIRWLFQNTPRFTLWAIGVDLRVVAMGSRAQMRRIVVPHANHQKYLKEMVGKPLVQHVLSTGQRIAPAPRALPNPAPLWAPSSEGVDNTRPPESKWVWNHERRLRGYRKTAWDILERYKKTGVQF